jgi:hypothetical protein
MGGSSLGPRLYSCSEMRPEGRDLRDGCRAILPQGKPITQ